MVSFVIYRHFLKRVNIANIEVYGVFMILENSMRIFEIFFRYGNARI